MKRHKYNAKKTTIAGIEFDSKKEAERYLVLKSLEQNGNITDLEIQPEFVLQPSFRRNGRVIRAIKYRADFRYVLMITPPLVVVEDVKGMRTKEYMIKKKMFLHQHPAILFKEV